MEHPSKGKECLKKVESDVGESFAQREALLYARQEPATNEGHRHRGTNIVVLK